MRPAVVINKVIVKNDIILAKFKQIKQKISQSVPLDLELDVIKERTLSELREWINANRNRPMGTYDRNFQRMRRLTSTENLYHTIKASSQVVLEGEGKVRLVIGEYSYLDQFAPYWRVLNDGGYVPPSFMGFFGDNRVRPRPGVTNLQTFYKTGYPASDGGKTWLMRPQNPITPMRFVSELNRIFEEQVAGYNFGGKYSGVTGL